MTGPLFAKRLAHFLFEPSQPLNLGLGRIVFYALVLLAFVSVDHSLWSTVPDAFWMPKQFFKHLHIPVFPQDVIAGLDVLWKVSLFFSCIGFLTRGSTALTLVLGGYLLGLPHNFGKTHHTDAVLVLIFVILAASRCGDAMSVDSWIRRKFRNGDTRPKPLGPSSEYTWPVRSACVLLCIVFFAAGMAKLRHSGLAWILSDNMANLLVLHHHTGHTPAVDWGLLLAQSHWGSRLMAAFGMGVEILAPLSIFSRRCRIVLVPSLLGMQLSIWALLGVRFSTFLIAYIWWVPWDSLWRRAFGGSAEHGSA